MRSAWSAGILMIVMGGIGISGFGQQHPVGPVPYALAGLLVAGGALLFLRRPFAFYPAIVASVLLVLSGGLGYLHHPELGLPVPPLLALVIGLYLCLRVILVRSTLQPRRKRAFLSDEEPPTDGSTGEPPAPEGDHK
jgi:hypothetical protein